MAEALKSLALDSERPGMNIASTMNSSQNGDKSLNHLGYQFNLRQNEDNYL